ncbi:hypothetical protein NKF26_15010 [Haladaptatus sp. AB618]|uniref:DUF7344 domain-containing protein n=1 Tax=Haladaptatus sp. AB618 TaxID=2934173 RepID=UPI00209C5B83|nr:hypothetical protein [Haladaptatus sp. AB618]MCO8255113.1 hypothetical protein [Haladaptatus sp. AB618]
MEKQNRPMEPEVQHPMFAAVETNRRRSTLAILLDRTAATDERELARLLAATEGGTQVADVSEEDVRAIRLDLHHKQLPVLRNSGLVGWDEGTGTVTTTDHRALTDPRFRQLLETEEAGVDDVLFGLSDRRRRYLLSVLRDNWQNRTAMSRSALARRIARHETDTEEPDQSTLDEILVALTHIHLPMLATADIVRYNPESGRVAYTGNPALEKVVTIFNEPDNRLVSRLDGFFGGLLTSYQEAGGGTGTSLDWPSFWRDPHHG